MKTIIRYLLVSLTVFLTIQCDVRNEQPIPQNIEPNIESTGRVEYVNIIKPYVYKENVYFIDLGTTGKMTFINDKEVVFSGDFTVNRGNKKLRMAADEIIEDGGIIYESKENKDFNLAMTLSNGTRISAGIKYSFLVSEPNNGVQESKVAYKTNFEFDFNSDIVVANILDNLKGKTIEKLKQNGVSIYVDCSPKINIKYSTTTIEEVKNGKTFSGKKTEVIIIEGGVNVQIRGKLDYKKHLNDEEKQNLEKETFIQMSLFNTKGRLGQLRIPGTPIAITPDFDFGIGFKNESELSIGINVFKGKKTDSTILEFIDGGYKPLKTKTESSLNIFSVGDEKMSPFVGAINSEFKAGFYITITSHINKYLIPLTDTYVSAGFINFTAFAHGFFKIDPLENNCDERITYTPRLEFFYAYGLGTIDIDGVRESLINKEFKIDELGIDLGQKLNIAGILCEKKEIPTLSFTDFQKLLKDLRFEMAIGLTPRNIDGIYTFYPNMLAISNFKPDGLPETFEEADAKIKRKLIPYGKIEIEISSNPRKIKIRQYDLKTNSAIAIETTNSFIQDGYALGINPLVTIEPEGFSILCALDGEVQDNGNTVYTDYLALTIRNNNTSGYVKYRVINRNGQYQQLPVGTYRIFIDNDQVTKQPI